MSFVETIFNQDIILDEDAFNAAVEDFADLSNQVEGLRANVVEMLDTLKEGFNTPAGVKFINSCEKNLLKPLDDQKLVLDHVSSTLQESRRKYSSVFQEYASLQTSIRQPI